MNRIPFRARRLFAAFSCFAFLNAVPVSSEDRFEDRIVLEISGEISGADGQNNVQFTRSEIEALGLVRVKTETPWTEGIITFEGVLVRELLQAVGATGNMVDARALNDYGVKVPVADFEENDVIVATRLDGEPLSVRDRGPLWVIYPWSDEKSLQSDLHYSRSIWQLKSLRVISE